jgi:hypothetical protein
MSAQERIVHLDKVPTSGEWRRHYGKGWKLYGELPPPVSDTPGFNFPDVEMASEDDLRAK